MRRLLAACLLALTTGCNPVQTPPPGDGGAGTARSFTFVIENFDADAAPVTRRVNLIITVFGRDGKPAYRVNPSNGLEQRGTNGPIELESVQTPFEYTVSGVDIGGASLTVQFVGREFEQVECRVVSGGVLVPGSANRVRIEGASVAELPGGTRMGIVTVPCLHLL